MAVNDELRNRAAMIRACLRIRSQISDVWSADVARALRAAVLTAGHDKDAAQRLEVAMQVVAGNVLGVYQLVEDIQRAGFNQHGVKVACPSDGGCFACCCEMVEVSPVEAAVIAYAVVGLDDERGPTLKRLAEWSNAFTAMIRANGGKMPEPTDYIKAHLRCPFLGADDRCVVYDWRPSVCRTYVSEAGRAACHAALGADEMHTLIVPAVPEAGAVAGLTLAAEKFTVIMQQAVAWYLGSPITPVTVHDMSGVFNDIEALAKDGTDQGADEGGDADADVSEVRGGPSA